MPSITRACALSATATAATVLLTGAVRANEDFFRRLQRRRAVSAEHFNGVTSRVTPITGSTLQRHTGLAAMQWQTTFGNADSQEPEFYLVRNA